MKEYKILRTKHGEFADVGKELTDLAKDGWYVHSFQTVPNQTGSVLGTFGWWEVYLLERDVDKEPIQTNLRYVEVPEGLEIKTPNSYTLHELLDFASTNQLNMADLAITLVGTNDIPPDVRWELIPSKRVWIVSGDDIRDCVDTMHSANEFLDDLNKAVDTALKRAIKSSKM